jgi:hypothetical protein
VVQVIVDSGTGSKDYGSGYLISESYVLTAAHNLRNARTRADVTIRIHRRDDTHVDLVAGDLELDEPTASDLATVQISLDVLPTPWYPTLFARLDPGEGSVPATIQGFPRWRLREAEDSPGRKVYREFADEPGELRLNTSDAHRRFDFVLRDHAPAPAADRTSPWGAISGGPVWVRGRLVGVVTEHHPREGEGRLRIRSVDAIYRIRTGYLRESFIERLALPDRRDELQDARGLGGTGRQDDGSTTEFTPLVRYVLQWRAGDGELLRRSLWEGADVSVGRGPLNEVSVPEEESMSARHCTVRARCDPYTGELRVCLIDVSTNGTFVNGTRVTRHAPVHLADGDVITIGENTRIHLHAAHH